jgi:aryl-alcohol dehydrogenase-like predicted oxidoreductase
MSQMPYVTICPGLTPSSRLGFGCGSVMGRVGKAESLRAIAAALDAGITHFDVARLYGYGEAEALLGEALRGRRDRVVIASKFGLEPPRAASVLRRLKPLAQKMVGNVPGARPLLRSVIGTKEQPADRFSVAAARTAIEQSLAALRTDYLDILFLHDCRPDDFGDELAGFLDGQVAAGTIRAYGVAADIETVSRIRRRHGDSIVCQFGNSLIAPNAARLPAGEPRFICHSPFLGADRLRVALNTGDDTHRLMLEAALAVESVAVVLCSMLDPAHLRANVAAITEPRYTADDFRACAASLATAA